MTNVERYIAYDYFKAGNLPEIKQIEPTALEIQMDKTGSYIYFDAIKSNHYSLIKAYGDSNFILESVMEKNGKIEIKDSDIFKHNEITYSLVCNEEIVATAKIRPKEYLLNLIEQQMLNGKSRWFV